MGLTLPPQPKLVAFTGYGGSGKDEAARPMAAHGYTRRCFGDVIKKQIDPLIQEHLGFSAFTDNPVRKLQIRPVLEQWGEVNYANIRDEFFKDLPEYCVNTRISRMAEVEEWIQRGGVLFAVSRPGVVAQTPWEARVVEEHLAHDCISLIILNDRDTTALHRLMVDLLFWEEGKDGWKRIQNSRDRPWHVRVSGGLGSLRQLPATPDRL